MVSPESIPNSDVGIRYGVPGIQPIGLADPMIAAIGLTHGLELVTGNTAHYQRIQQLGYPLTLVNWRQ